MSRWLIGIAVSILLLAFGWTWLWGGYSDASCIDAYPDLAEGSAYHTEAGLWPPGGRCVYELPSGDVIVRDGPVPWFEWSLLALLGAIVGGLALLHLKTRLRAPSP